MTELKKVRVGVVGVGALGQWHAKNYAAIPGAELAGVYDIDAGRASEIAMRYNTRTFASIEELAEAVDAASVVVPPSKHFYAAGILLERGAGRQLVVGVERTDLDRHLARQAGGLGLQEVPHPRLHDIRRLLGVRGCCGQSCAAGKQ